MQSIMAIVLFLSEVLAPEQCTSHANSLSEATALFETECAGEMYHECSQTDSDWICTATTEPPSMAESSPPQSENSNAESVVQCAAQGDTIEQARENFSSQCPQYNIEDCDATEGVWVCANYSDPIPSETLAEANPNPAEPEIGAADTNPQTPNTQLPEDSRYRTGDLIAIHFDHAPDYDDGHATVANKMVVDHYGLNSEVMVVAGTYNQARKNVYRSGSEAVTDITWGTEGKQTTWYNADARYQNSIAESVRLWRETLSAGGKVWVAEGGPSEFTARVLEQLTDVNRKRITVIQHSHCSGKSCNQVKGGQNERFTPVADIRFIENVANMVRIGNGNTGNNNTPDLNQKNSAVAQDLLSSSKYGAMWKAAFNYFDPDERLDASDTVELLWVLGIENEDIQDWNQFRDAFLQ